MFSLSKQNMDDFLSGKKIAIAGYSREEKSFSREAAKHLEDLGYEIWGINPNFEATSPDDRKVHYPEDLPADVTRLLVLTPATQTENVMLQAINKGIRHIWIQQKSETPAAIALAKEKEVNLVFNHCIFMFTQPEGVHKFHYRLKKFFGGIPK